MDITPPFGFGSITPLRPDLKVLDWRNAPTPVEYSTLNAVPISMGESWMASRDYPLVFAENGGLMAVLGFADKENLYWKDGAWDSTMYVPAMIRRYPFCTTLVRIDGVVQQQPLMCVESSFVNDAGEPVIDNNRAPIGDFLQQAQLVEAFDRDLQMTAALEDMLRKHGLIKPFDLTATLRDGTQFQMGGMWRVDEMALKEVAAKTLRTLIESGAMRLAYTHLNSMANFDRLLDRKYAGKLFEGMPLREATAATPAADGGAAASLS
jgi:hypothetical protein